MKYEVNTKNGKEMRDGDVDMERGIGICKKGLEWLATDLYSGGEIAGGTTKEKCLENVESVWDKITQLRQSPKYLQVVVAFKGNMEGVMV